MKLALSTLLLSLVFANAQVDDAQLAECTDCLEDIDDARDCLRECNNDIFTNSQGLDVSRLSECLRDDGDFGNIDTLGQLSECCVFDRGCENDLFDVQECLVGCLDTCIKDDAKEYLDCVTRETGSSGCELTTCLDGFLSDDIEDDINLAGSEDIFDVRSIANAVEGISEDDVSDCELLRDFVETACDLGRSCCDRCVPELGAVVGCLVNDIVIPFVAIETNTTIDECPINEQECQLLQGAVRKTKELSQEEADLFNKAVNLPRGKAAPEGSTKRDSKREAMVEAAKKRKLDGATTEEEVEACEQKMRMDMIAANMTHASNKFFECVTGAAITSLEDADTEESEEESAAAAVAKFVALAFAFGSALLF